MDPLNSIKCAEIGQACLCANLRKASRLISQIYDEFLRPCGLKTTQFGLLMMVKGFGKSTVTRMAKWGVYDRTTFTRNLKLLEKNGFVNIEPGEDQREKVVMITKKGVEALLSGLPFWEKAQNQVAEIVGDDRTGRMVKELSSMVTLLRQK